MELNNEELDSEMEYVLRRSLMSKSKLAIILKDQNGDTQYCCVECPNRYKDKEKLEKHLCMHYKEYRYLCGICGTGLKRKEHLDRHTLEHQEVRPHECPVCGKAFKRKEHMNIHKSIHSGEKNEICPLCQRSFYRKDHLQKHLQTHNKWLLEQDMLNVSNSEVDVKQEVHDDLNLVITDVTGNVCEPEYLMETEQNSQDGNDESQESNNPTSDCTEFIAPFNPERPFLCCVCGKSYKRKDHLKLHSMTHMAKDKVCSECGKAFHKEEQLLVHMDIHLKPFSLDNGNYSMLNTSEDNMSALSPSSEGDSSNSLLVPRVPKSDYRPHECPVCQRKFKRKQHLKVHANVHLKQQPTVWCSVCSEGFFTNYEFQNHRCMSTNSMDNTTQVVHIDSDDEQTGVGEPKSENHPLDLVEVTQDENESNSSQHSTGDENSQNTTSTSSELGLPVPQRVFVCKYCWKPFRRKDHYKIHLHIHTGIKSFFCPDCGKGFYRKDHLQKHALVHAKVKLAKEKDKKETLTKKPKKQLPELYPISLLPKKSQKQSIKPEITIHAPSNTKLRLPLQIKVPYQMVMSMENGEQRAVTIDPQANTVTEDVK